MERRGPDGWWLQQVQSAGLHLAERQSSSERYQPDPDSPPRWLSSALAQHRAGEPMRTISRSIDEDFQQLVAPDQIRDALRRHHGIDADLVSRKSYFEPDWISSSSIKGATASLYTRRAPWSDPRVIEIALHVLDLREAGIPLDSADGLPGLWTWIWEMAGYQVVRSPGEPYAPDAVQHYSLRDDKSITVDASSYHFAQIETPAACRAALEDAFAGYEHTFYTERVETHNPASDEPAIAYRINELPRAWMRTRLRSLSDEQLEEAARKGKVKVSDSPAGGFELAISDQSFTILAARPECYRRLLTLFVPPQG